MEKQELLKKLDLILSDLRKQLDKLSDNSAAIDEIELELFSAHAVHLSDYARILKILLSKDLPDKAASPGLRGQPPAEQSTKREDEEVRAPLRNDMAGEVVPQPENFPRNTPPEKTGEDLFTGPSRDPREQREADEAPGETPKEARSETPGPVSADPGNRNPGNERFRTRDSDSDQGRISPVRNLSRSIGLNERYYFIKNLFRNDKVAFDQAITRIDMCTSLGEAMEYINRSLAGKYGWSNKEEDARNFYELVKRRFI